MSNLIRKQSDCIKATFIHSKAVIPPSPPHKNNFFVHSCGTVLVMLMPLRSKAFTDPKNFLCFTIEEGAKFFKNKNKLVKTTAVDSRQIVN